MKMNKNKLAAIVVILCGALRIGAENASGQLDITITPEEQKKVEVKSSPTTNQSATKVKKSKKVAQAESAIESQPEQKAAEKKATVVAQKSAAVAKKSKKIKKKKSDDIEQKDELPADAYLVDKINAIVFAQEGQQLITKSDSERLSLEGKPRTLDELILEKLMYLDGLRFKMQADDETIDKHLALIQRENKMTLEDLKKVFQSAGYSYEEGRQQFGMISVINQLLDFKIRSRLIVPEKEVVAYYNAHPEKQEATFYIQRALIYYSEAKTKQAQQEEIELFVTENKGLLKIDWQDPFWVNAGDLAESKKFITFMEQGSISMPQRTPEGFELIKLVEKKAEHMRSLDDRYREISDILRKPRYENLFSDYKNQLFDGASILYFN